jgi:PilZ domain
LGRRAVNRRSTDRRGRKRFEIVGSLTGTLETWERLTIRNLSAAGALVETTTPFAVGDHISGRLLYQNRARNMRGEVRRVALEESEKGEKSYLVGILWTGSVGPVDELLADQPPESGQTVGQDVDRRQSQRVNWVGRAELGQPKWTTVDLLDISGSGVLFVVRESLTVGDRGKLKLRLGDQSLTAEVEVRREDPHASDRSGYRVGASFVALDEAARVLLENFVGDRRP